MNARRFHLTFFTLLSLSACEGFSLLGTGRSSSEAGAGGEQDSMVGGMPGASETDGGDAPGGAFASGRPSVAGGEGGAFGGNETNEAGASGARVYDPGDPGVELAGIFDGIDDRVRVAARPEYDLGSGDFTLLVVARVDPSRSGAVVPFLSGRSTETDGFLFIGYHGTLLLQMNGVPNFVVNGDVPELSDGCWHSFGVARAAGHLTFYVDGRPSPGYMDRVWDVPAVTTRSMNVTAPIQIGFDEPTGSAFAGAISRVGFWSRALAASELSGTSPSQLLGRWTLGLGVGQVIYDVSNLGNNAHLGTDPLGADNSDPILAQVKSECLPVPAP